MTLTPEDRQRIYEEEKARREAQDRLKRDKSATDRNGCLGVIGVLIVFGIIVSVFSSSSHKEPPSGTNASPVSDGTPTQSTDGLFADIQTMTAGLHDMNTSIAGNSMDHIKLSLDVFSAAATLIQRAQDRQLSADEAKRLAGLRKLLILRQRQAFPIIRRRIGPLMRSELWIADAEATEPVNDFETLAS